MLECVVCELWTYSPLPQWNVLSVNCEPTLHCLSGVCCLWTVNLHSTASVECVVCELWTYSPLPQCNVCQKDVLLVLQNLDRAVQWRVTLSVMLYDCVRVWERHKGKITDSLHELCSLYSLWEAHTWLRFVTTCPRAQEIWKVTGLPKMLLAWPKCYWPAQNITGLPKKLLACPKWYWPAQNVTGMPKMLLACPTRHWPAHNVTGRPKMLLAWIL